MALDEEVEAYLSAWFADTIPLSTLPSRVVISIRVLHPILFKLPYAIVFRSLLFFPSLSLLSLDSDRVYGPLYSLQFD